MAAIEPKLTVDDLALLPDDGNRYELIEGELFVSSAPSLFHQRIAGRLFSAFDRYFAQQPIGEVIATPGMIFSFRNGMIPDLIVMTHERRAQIERDGRLHGAPELVIEILSPGNENRRRDEVIKRQAYAKFGVDEYWIVDPEQQTIAVYRLQNGVLQPEGTWAAQDQFATPLLPDFALDVGRIFAA